MDLACAAEAAVPNLPGTLGMEYKWKIRTMLEKSKPAPPNLSKQEFIALKSLKHNKDIRILKADEGNCAVVLNDSEYMDKLNLLLHSGVYEPLSKDTTKTVEKKVQKILSKHKAALPTGLKHKLTPYHSKPSHLYGFPKIHKSGIPLRLIVSSIGSSCYALAGFLHKILSLLVGQSQSFVKYSGHFIQ
jgi:hypothetical protein